jgi:hypothetical protein
MWGQQWGQMIWGRLATVPATSFWSLLILGALLGAVGVRFLRGPRPRRLAMFVLVFAVLIPITVRAVPFTFTNGTVADATQVNANFAAVAPVTGFFGTTVNGALVSPTDILTPSFVAPRALTCVVHLDARMFFNVVGPTGTDLLSVVKRENGTTSLAFAPPSNSSIPTEFVQTVGSPVTASQTRLFTVANGATIQFGCRIEPTGTFATAAAVTQCTTVYECF